MAVRNDIPGRSPTSRAGPSPRPAPFAVLRARVVPQKNGLSVKDGYRQPEPGPAARGVHCRAERRRDDPQSRTCRRCAPRRRRAGSSRPRSTSDGDGHVRLHAEVPLENRRRRRRSPTATGEALAMIARPEANFRDRQGRRQADGRGSSRRREVPCAGRIARRTGLSPGPAPGSSQRRRTCCSTIRHHQA